MLGKCARQLQIMYIGLYLFFFWGGGAKPLSPPGLCPWTPLGEFGSPDQADEVRYLIKCSIVLAKCARLQIMYVYLGFVGGMGGGQRALPLDPAWRVQVPRVQTICAYPTSKP